MKKAANHPYNKFIKELNKTTTSEERRWYGLTFSDTNHVLRFWDSLSHRSKSKIVSDSRWNHYPMCSFSKLSRKRFGAIIGNLITRDLNSGDLDAIKPLVNNSGGVFALYVLDNAPTSIRIKMAKRLMTSPDTRVRTRCARILPVKFIKPMLEDKNYSVRNIAITRVGIDNCYKDFIPQDFEVNRASSDWWWKNWLGRQALKLGDKEELSSLIVKAKNLDLSKVDVRNQEMLLSTLISRLTPEEALYFIGHGEVSDYIKRALKSKLDNT
jgi:hypothetical protein